MTKEDLVEWCRQKHRVQVEADNSFKVFCGNKTEMRWQKEVNVRVKRRLLAVFFFFLR